MKLDLNDNENVTDILALEIGQRNKYYKKLSDEFNALLEKRDLHEKVIWDTTRKINELRQELNDLEHLIWHSK